MEQEANADVWDARGAHSKETTVLEDESEIEISLNGEVRRVRRGICVSKLLKFYQLPEKNCAVERNRSIVPKTQYTEVQIQQGDLIEIVRFVGGG